MISERSTTSGHSAQVKITMFMNGNAIPVAQLGPGFLLLDKPFDHSPAEASILLKIDESERRWNVRLPEGISAGSKRVAIANL